MKMDLTFSSNNSNKIKEVQNLLTGLFNIKSLKDIGCFDEIPEPHQTIEENAREKSFYVYNKFGKDCFSDDTGLEIDALNGAPGVHSAYYAGVQKSAHDNMNKVLGKMAGIENRSARFKTVISLVIKGEEVQFTGVVEGQILKTMKGENGFGYDPVFEPLGSGLSFGEMDQSLKNTMSHRAIAVKKLVSYLRALSV